MGHHVGVDEGEWEWRAAKESSSSWPGVRPRPPVPVRPEQSPPVFHGCDGRKAHKPPHSWVGTLLLLLLLLQLQLLLLLLLQLQLQSVLLLLVERQWQWRRAEQPHRRPRDRASGQAQGGIQLRADRHGDGAGPEGVRARARVGAVQVAGAAPGPHCAAWDAMDSQAPQRLFDLVRTGEPPRQAQRRAELPHGCANSSARWQATRQAAEVCVAHQAVADMAVRQQRGDGAHRGEWCQHGDC
jgi:hypothetical protein